MIVLGEGEDGLSARLATLMKARHVNLEITEFPDGEYKVKIPENVEGEEVLIVHSTHYPQDKRLFQLLVIADLLGDMGAKKIGAVIPYLAFARQNKRFIEGESVSLKTVLHLLNSVGIDYLVTVQPHKKDALTSFKGKVVTIEPIATLVQVAGGHVSKPFVLAPDKGSIDLARSAAKALKCKYTYLDKQRDLVSGAVSIKNAPKDDMVGKDVIIVDDMISTGGTIAQSSRFAYSKGARKVIVAAIHLLMVGDAFAKLKEAGANKIFGASTVPYNNAVIVDITEDIANGIKKNPR